MVMVKHFSKKDGLVFGLLLFAGLIAGCALQLASKTEIIDPASLAKMETGDTTGPLVINEPADGAVYPIDLAPPLFAWQGASSGRWVVRVEAEGRTPGLLLGVSQNPWQPTSADWEQIKRLALGEPLTMTVMQIKDHKATGSGQIHFSVSPYPLACQVVYQELPVPFNYAAKHVDRFAWRTFEPASLEPPQTVLTGLPYCGCCHTFSRDGTTFGMDVDYRKDRGGYVLTDVKPQMDLHREDIISWNDHQRGEGQVSRGLFARISPDGDHVMATVKDKPFLVRIKDPAYSQLFFPLTGYLAFYSRNTGKITPLKGADDPNVIQTSPAWSPDGRTIVFARAQSPDNLWQALGNKPMLDAAPGETIDVLNQTYRMHFDLWQVPFAGGEGGQATPLQGACANQKSNYFPRYSPDGRWIVFCQCDTGLVSQPGSKLIILPAAGGTPRIMRCNRPELNSWHSFSPNGRWLVFSSKPDDSRLTRAYLSYFDEQGQSYPAVRLHRIGSPGLAAILPETVALPPHAFKQVKLAEP